MAKASTRLDELGALYEDHVDEVYGFLYRRCRDTELAEDVTHDVFVAAGRAIGESSDLSIGWLLTVARNRLIDVVRRQDRFRHKLRLIQAERHDDDWSEAEVDRLALQETLAQLRVDQRLVLTLRYIDGYTVPQLADLMHRTPKAIERLSARARNSLRQELEKRDD